MTPARQLPLPGSPEARNLGCTCPEAGAAQPASNRVPAIDAACPIHGEAAMAHGRAAEPGRIDTEGDIVDAASEPELRRS